MKARRVLTVYQANVGSKTDFGVMGYVPDRLASYLVFPKPLPDLPEARIVGIKYDLLDQPPVKNPFKLSSAQSKKQKRPENVIPLPKTFAVVVERMATWKQNQGSFHQTHRRLTESD